MKKIERWGYAAVGVIILLMAGLVYAWTIMSKSIGAAYPEWTATQLSVTFTLTMMMFCFGCLGAGVFSKKVNPKIYIRIAAVLFFAGFLLAASVQDTPLLLYIGFGGMCGLGSGIAYNAVMSTLSLWFLDKQGMISGILLMGFGVSSFIVGKFFAALSPADGGDAWRITFRIFAAVICLTLAVCSFFLKKPEEDFVPPADKKKTKAPAMEATTGQMLRLPAFWCYYVWAILLSCAGLALVSQASGIAGQVGANAADGTIATVVGLISVMNGIGRVFFGSLFDRSGFRTAMLVDMVMFIAACVLLITALQTEQFVMLIIGFCAGGLAYGGVTPMNSAVTSDFFGHINYSMNFSIINTVLIFASFSSTIAGKLYDMSGSYMSTIAMMLGATVFGFVIFIWLRRPET